MTIRIEAKKVLTDIGDKGFEITQIKALSCEDIKEKEYFNSTHCFANTEGKSLRIKVRDFANKEEKAEMEESGLFVEYAPNLYVRHMYTGDVYSEKDFDLLINIIHQCEQNLRKLKEKRREMEKEWTGTIEIVI